MRLLGAVLAGGQSRRFGSDKAMALLEGRPLIEHTNAALAAQTDAVIIVGREGEGCIPDRPIPEFGPLGGISAALMYAWQNGFDAVLTCPCDVPSLPPNLAGLLAGGGYLAEMPVIGLWPGALICLDAYLGDEDLEDFSVRRCADVVGLKRVELGAPIANINTPEDLADLTRGPAG